MAESADFLHHEEKIRADGGVNETYRAIALSRAVQLAETFELVQTIDEQYVESLRSKIETLKPKQVKALARGALQVAALFGDSPVERTSVVVESIPEQVLSEPEIASELEPNTEAVVAVEGGEAPEQLGAQAAHLLSKAIGPYDDLNITTDDAGKIAAIFVELRGETRINKNSLDFKAILTKRFQNESLADIAQAHNSTASSLSTGLALYVKKIREIHGSESIGELFRTKLAHEAPKETKDLVEEKVILTHGAVAAEWADRLEFDKKTKQALKEFLDPFSAPNLSIPKKQAIEAVIAYISEHFKTIDNPALGLSDEQRLVLRHITGAWYSTINGQNPERTPKTMASILRSQTERRREDLVASAFSGLHAILEIDPEQVAPFEPIAVAEKPKPQPPKTRLRIVEKEVVSHEEWRAEASRLLQARFVERGHTAEQAATLWSIVHFDEAGAYKLDTPERRTVMASLQDTLASSNLRMFTNKEAALQSVKMLTTAAFGLKTLDDIQQKLLEKNPSITKDDIEKQVVMGVGLLLR